MENKFVKYVGIVIIWIGIYVILQPCVHTVKELLAPAYSDSLLYKVLDFIFKYR